MENMHLTHVCQCNATVLLTQQLLLDNNIISPSVFLKNKHCVSEIQYRFIKTKLFSFHLFIQFTGLSTGSCPQSRSICVICFLLSLTITLPHLQACLCSFKMSAYPVHLSAKAFLQNCFSNMLRNISKCPDYVYFALILIHVF